MKLKTLKALQDFVMAVKHSPAIESDLDLMRAGDELDSLFEEEIQAKITEDMETSACCGAPRRLDLESNICSECKEHADFIEEKSDEAFDNDTELPELLKRQAK